MSASSKHFSNEMPDENLSSGIFRYALGVEYLGSRYCGWQRQEQRQDQISQVSVQSEVETALARVADASVMTVCAGRTDSGVHGREQVIHFETTARRPLKAWVLGVNSHLPRDISVLWARQVPSDFHARFSALARTYRYFINNRPERPAIAAGLMTWVHEPLDTEAMHRAAQSLLGERDFSSFRGASCQSRTPYRRLMAIAVRREGQRVVVEVKANAFLHHMVRNIVGSLLEVGRGRQPESWIGQVLEARNRDLAGMTALPQGLFLWCVDYPEHFGLPQIGSDHAGLPG